MHVSAKQRLRLKETTGKDRDMLSLSAISNTGVLHTEERARCANIYLGYIIFFLYVLSYLFIFTSVYVCE